MTEADASTFVAACLILLGVAVVLVTVTRLVIADLAERRERRRRVPNHTNGSER